MKILAISHEYPPIGGGGANACYFLLHGFAQNGHQVTLITANYGQRPREEQVDGFSIIRVNAKREHKEHCSFIEMADFLVKAYFVADKAQREEKFDVCLVFFGIPSGPIGYMLKRKYGLPYAIRFGGGDIPGTQKRFTLIYKILAPFIKGIWNNADALIANSAGLKERALRFYRKKDFEVICNGVDTSVYYNKENKETEKFNVLFVSRLLERKGMQYIIPQLSELYDKMKGNLKLTIVGDGPYRQTLEIMVKENSVQHIVDFVGQIEKQEIVQYYQSANIFILPSDWEGMPNVVLEAMASGLPVIMTPCEGSDELINGNGYVVPSQEFGDKIYQLYCDKQLCETMSRVSRKRAEEIFSWENAVQKYIKLLSGL